MPRRGAGVPPVDTFGCFGVEAELPAKSYQYRRGVALNPNMSLTGRLDALGVCDRRKLDLYQLKGVGRR